MTQEKKSAHFLVKRLTAANLTLSTAVNLFSGPILSLFAPGTGEEISRSISVGQIRLLVVGMTYCLAGITRLPPIRFRPSAAPRRL